MGHVNKVTLSFLSTIVINITDSFFFYAYIKSGHSKNILYPPVNLSSILHFAKQVLYDSIYIFPAKTFRMTIMKWFLNKFLYMAAREFIIYSLKNKV